MHVGFICQINCYVITFLKIHTQFGEISCVRISTQNIVKFYSTTPTPMPILWLAAPCKAAKVKNMKARYILMWLWIFQAHRIRSTQVNNVKPVMKDVSRASTNALHVSNAKLEFYCKISQSLHIQLSFLFYILNIARLLIETMGYLLSSKPKHSPPAWASFYV